MLGSELCMEDLSLSPHKRGCCPPDPAPRRSGFTEVRFKGGPYAGTHQLAQCPATRAQTQRCTGEAGVADGALWEPMLSSCGVHTCETGPEEAARDRVGSRAAMLWMELRPLPGWGENPALQCPLLGWSGWALKKDRLP